MHADVEATNFNLYGPVNPEEFQDVITEITSHPDPNPSGDVLFDLNMALFTYFADDDDQSPDPLAAVDKELRIFFRYISLTRACRQFPARFGGFVQMPGNEAIEHSNYLLMAAAVCPFATYAGDQSTFDLNKLLALAVKFRDSNVKGEMRRQRST
jgi:hypothetical protein